MLRSSRSAPAVDPVELPPSLPGSRSGGEGANGKGHGDDYLGLRPLRDGEDPRDVHWRKSAALGQLVARERARETRPDIVLPIDLTRPALANVEESETLFERRIREVASRAVAHLKRGDVVTLRASTGERTRADRGVGADPILRYLALADAIDAKPEAAE